MFCSYYKVTKNFANYQIFKDLIFVELTLNNLQIVVEGIEGAATDWAMSCNFTDPSNVYYIFGVRESASNNRLYSNDNDLRYNGNSGIAGGVANGTDGAAFYFNVSNQRIKNVEVTLYNANGDVYKYTLPNTAPYVEADKFKAGKIAFSKFVKQ